MGSGLPVFEILEKYVRGYYSFFNTFEAKILDKIFGTNVTIHVKQGYC